MASQINASNSGFGGIVSTGDSSGVLQLQTAGTTAVTIDTSQNVGIGTSSPQNDAGYKTLTVNGTSGGQVSFKTNDANIGSIYSLSTALNLTTGTSIPMVFQTNGSERMRIDSNGYVTKPFQPAFAVNGTGSGNKTAGTVLGFTDAAGGSTQITYNISGSWSNANNRFTAPVAGIYLFNAAIYVQNSTTAIQSIAPRLNGSQIAGLSDTFILFSGLVAAGNTDNQVRGTFTLRLAAGDYVDIAVRSGAQTIAYYGGHSFFQGYLLG